MELFKDSFSKSKEEHKVICLYLNGEDSEFWCGYILDYNEEIVIIRHYTKFGMPDGVIIEKIVNIERVRYDNNYCNLMTKLISNPSVLDFKDEIQVDINLTSNWQHDTLEQILNKPNRIVRIEIDKNLIYCGIVKWLDNDNVIIIELDGHGVDEGNSILRIEDITEIRINDLECRRRLLFYKWRNESPH